MIEEAGLAERGTFLVEHDGLIKVDEINEGGIGSSEKDMLGKVKEDKQVREKDGEVWIVDGEKGGDTLKPSLDLVGKI